MPSPSLPPSQHNNSAQSASQPQLPPLLPPATTTNGPQTYAVPESPVAPEFSPITPKAQPALPATYSPLEAVFPATNGNANADVSLDQHPSTAIASTQFIPQPPPQPFSSEDATDAIALRAAISSLQFQRKKAQDDLRALEKIKKKAIDEPTLFKNELAAGRLSEQKPKVGDLRAILDEPGDDSDDDQIMPDAPTGVEPGQTHQSNGIKSESTVEDQDSKVAKTKTDPTPFESIPGPQNIIRMPYINWDKYHISGDPLDALHEQQRKWPGSFAYGQARGREHTVAAPYSPWLDQLDTQQQSAGAEGRNDSVTTPGTAITPTSGSISEHPMETRRRQGFQ